MATDILYVSIDPERAGYLPHLSGKETLELLKEVKPGQKIIVFKNNPAIERYCNEHNIILLNPSAELAEKIENKITQVEFLGELASFLPKFSIQKVKDITWPTPFILQWAHGHTGEGTFLVTDLSQVKDFPERECKITEVLKGPTFTVNIVVGDTIEIGNISYQITGLKPYTDNPYATVGNDWSLATQIAPKEDIMSLAQKIGEKMKDAGWKGLFGIDVLLADRLYLIEINARQPASATYESTLQKTNTIFDNHIKALTGQPLHKNTVITEGAQIVDRRTMKWDRSEHGIINKHDNQTN